MRFGSNFCIKFDSLPEADFINELRVTFEAERERERRELNGSNSINTGNAGDSFLAALSNSRPASSTNTADADTGSQDSDDLGGGNNAGASKGEHPYETECEQNIRCLGW